uniref:Uncharacterized protein n=1 Tax=Anguilla anguilla TaxID=7936 RepID=A0A0E9SAR3_ANGAN
MKRVFTCIGSNATYLSLPDDLEKYSVTVPCAKEQRMLTC